MPIRGMGNSVSTAGCPFRAPAYVMRRAEDPAPRGAIREERDPKAARRIPPTSPCPSRRVGAVLQGDRGPAGGTFRYRYSPPNAISFDAIYRVLKGMPADITLD